jgi:hypothetical protein
LLKKYGAKEFFLEFRKNADPDVVESIDGLLSIVVRDNQENDSTLSN